MNEKTSQPNRVTPDAPADPNATGATEPLPGDRPGLVGRETHEREAALSRGVTPTRSRGADEPSRLSGLAVHRLFTALAENVRDYAIFLTDAEGIIRYWGEGARLMKWWTKEQVEGSHLRALYVDGGYEDGTAEEHLRTAAARGEYTGEGRRVRNDGSTFWAGVTMTALRDDDGTLLGFAKVRETSRRDALLKQHSREPRMPTSPVGLLKKRTGSRACLWAASATRCAIR